jgi:hypothetical protein
MKRKTKRKSKEKNAFDKAKLSWKAYERPQHNRGLLWKIIIAILVLSILTFGVYHRDYIFIIAFVLGISVYYLHNKKTDRKIEIKISEVGVQVDKRNYNFNEIKSFWILYDPPFVAKLVLELQGKLLTQLSIELGAQTPVEVHELLSQKLKEKKDQQESMIDFIQRILKI